MQVLDHEKFWVLDGVPGGHKWIILQDALVLLQTAIVIIHEKAVVRS